MNQSIYLYITSLFIVEVVFGFTNSTVPLTKDDIRKKFENELTYCETDSDCPNEYDVCIKDDSSKKEYCKTSYTCFGDKCYEGNGIVSWLCSTEDCFNTPDKCEVDGNQCTIKEICKDDNKEDCFSPYCYVDADCVSGTCKNNLCQKKEIEYICENMGDKTVKCGKALYEKCKKDSECFDDNCYEGECHPPSPFDFTPLIIIICSVVVACILLCVCSCYLYKKKRHN